MGVYSIEPTWDWYDLLPNNLQTHKKPHFVGRLDDQHGNRRTIRHCHKAAPWQQSSIADTTAFFPFTWQTRNNLNIHVIHNGCINIRTQLELPQKHGKRSFTLMFTVIFKAGFWRNEFKRKRNSFSDCVLGAWTWTVQVYITAWTWLFPAVGHKWLSLLK